MDIYSTTLLLLLSKFSSGRILNIHDTIECPPWNGDPVFLPDPTDCEKYYACGPTGPQPQTCPPGLWFDPSLTVCNYPEEVNCHGGCKSFPNRYFNL